MIKYVDYDKDIEKPFGDVLRGAYNKANIGLLPKPILKNDTTTAWKF